MMRWSRFSAAAGVVALASGGPARAQDAAAGAAMTLPTLSVEDRRQTPLTAVPTIGKTGTPIEDLPQSLQVVPREVFQEQGATELRQATRNITGLSEGGAASHGFYDRFTIRGLDVNFLRDYAFDGPLVNGYARSLTGIERIEVLRGPGSALFGTGAPGGTINLVRLRPDGTPSYSLEQTAGSFGTYQTTFGAQGSTPLPSGAAWRVDGTYLAADGWRGLGRQNIEILPTVSWRPTQDHLVTVDFDYRHLERTSDTYGTPFRGNALLPVPREYRFYTPFSNGKQDVLRAAVADQWRVSDFLTVNNRLTYLYRDLDLLRNAGGTVAANSSSLTGRVLRDQHDLWNSLVYQFEPVWRFATGPVGHTLLTGFELQHHDVATRRTSAALPDIANVFSPAVPERSVAGLRFSQNYRDRIDATYYGFYAQDQIDVTERLKLRLGLRYDTFDTALDRTQTGLQRNRQDGTVSWNAGALYKATDWLTPFVGASRSNLAVISTEADTTNALPPEKATQVEAGLRLTPFAGRLVATAAVFETKRANFLQTVGTEVVPVGEQRTRGVEFEVEARPIDSLVVRANYTHQDPKLTSFASDPRSQGRLPFGVPTEIFNVWAVQDLGAFGLGGFRLGGGVSHRSRVFGDNPNALRVPGFTLVDTVLSYDVDPKLQLSFGVYNLFDQAYFRNPVNTGALPGEPRSVLFRARVQL